MGGNFSGKVSTFAFAVSRLEGITIQCDDEDKDDSGEYLKWVNVLVKYLLDTFQGFEKGQEMKLKVPCETGWLLLQGLQ